MKKALKLINILLDFAISSICIVLAVRLVYTYNSLIEPGAILLILISMKCCVEVLLTV